MSDFKIVWAQEGWNSLTKEGSTPVEGQIANMQWPHVRLNPDSNPAANGMEGFYTWALADEFRQSWRPPRPDENFGSTVSENVRVVQASETKVHFAIRQSRRHPDGEEYNAFETLWLFVKNVHEEDPGGKPRASTSCTGVSGRLNRAASAGWGVAFRSSFLSSRQALADGARKRS